MPGRPLLVNGGRVSSRDPSLYGDGDLQEAQNCQYLEGDPAVHKAGGASEFNSTALGSIIGARYLEFEGGTDLFVVNHGTTLSKANAGLTGTFSDLVTGLTGGSTSLDSVHDSDEHYLLDGVNRNRTVASDGTARFHGMLANTTAPTLDTSVEASPNGITLTSGSTLTYWVEERVKDGSTIVRRSAETGTTTVTATGPITTQDFTVTRPAVVNSDATHWALYGTSTDGSFPTGAEIAEVVIGTASITDSRGDTANVDPEFPTGDTYQVVSTVLAGVTQNVARNGAPPISTTGDIFEDSMMLNDSTDRDILRFSFPGIPDAFPATNFLAFDTKEADEIIFIRSMGNFALVGMRNALFRVDTLPHPGDAAFMPERVKDKVRGAHGAVSPMAVAEFSFGQGPRLAYVSRYGVVVTDGLTWDVITEDMRWSSDVSISSLANARLVNNPAKFRLELDASAPGGGRRCWYFHYHPSHIKGNNRAKVSGPITRSATCSFIGNVGGFDIIFTGNTNGKLYQTDVGHADENGNALEMKVKTGDIYLEGIGGEAVTQKTWVHHPALLNQTATVGVTSRNSGRDDRVVSKTIGLDRRESTPAFGQVIGESFEYSFEHTANANAVVDYFAVEHKSARGAQGE